MCHPEECCSSERLSLSRVQQVRTREEEGVVFGGRYRQKHGGGVEGWGAESLARLSFHYWLIMSL